MILRWAFDVLICCGVEVVQKLGASPTAEIYNIDGRFWLCQNLRLVVKESCGGEVKERSEKSELELARNASEASNQLRRSPNSRNEVFGPFYIDIKSATGIWSCGGG